MRADDREVKEETHETGDASKTTGDSNEFLPVSSGWTRPLTRCQRWRMLLCKEAKV